MPDNRKRETAVPELVQEFGVNPSYLYKLIQMGTLEARRNTLGRWQVTQASFDRWNQRRLNRTVHQTEATPARPRQRATSEVRVGA